jgi:outer membrane biogenesis lipoprotein LolB
MVATSKGSSMKTLLLMAVGVPLPVILLIWWLT